MNVTSSLVILFWKNVQNIVTAIYNVHINFENNFNNILFLQNFFKSWGSVIPSYNFMKLDSWGCLSPLTLWVRTSLRRGELDTTLCDKVCQWLATCRRFSPVSSTNKTDRHDITEIVLKVALSTINLNRFVRFKIVYVLVGIYIYKFRKYFIFIWMIDFIFHISSLLNFGLVLFFCSPILVHTCIWWVRLLSLALYK